MIPRRSLPVRSLAAVAVAAAALALSGPAHAGGAREAQAKKLLKQAIDEDYLETRFDDAEAKLRKAFTVCGEGWCAPEVRAQLHAALGAVLATGKKELDDARDEFIEALKLDPTVEPDPGMISTGVTFAFEAAKKKLKIGDKPEPSAKAGPRADAKEDRPRDKPAPEGEPRAADKDDKDKPAEPEAPPARRNWITLSFSPDISIVAGTNVCTKDGQAAGHYVCVRNDADRTRYRGTPTLDNGDNINAGVGLATLRVMLAYDRLLGENFTLGARVGFAFNGASGGESSFLPLHLEGRFGYWPGKAPFVGSIVRPYIMISGGLAQIDTKVNVEVLEDGAACGAANPADRQSPCTRPSRDGVIEDRVQTLTVYKQAGLGFGGFTFGVHFAPRPQVALFLAVRGNVTFPVVTGSFSPEGGLSLGF